MKFSRYLFGFYLGISRLGSSPPSSKGLSANSSHRPAAG